MAAAAEVEFHRAGATIFSQGAEPVEHLRVVRAGAVEIVFDGRVLDLLGEGELFGHASMLSGLPTGFEARAGEDTVCYRIPAEIAQEPLSRPAGLRFVARSLLDIRYEGGAAVATEPGVDPPLQPVGSLLRSDPVVCRPDTTIREAAELMTAAHVDVRRRRPWRRLARDPHRPRPPHAGGRLRAYRGHTGVGGDVDAGLHLPAGPARWRCAARHARPGLSPLPGRVGDRDDPRSRRGDRPRRRANALVVLPAPADRPGPDRRGADRGGARVAPDGDRDARRPCRGLERRRRVLGRRGRADAAAARTVRCREPATWASSSRGWRWAARHGARPCRAPTSTARSCGSARPATPTCMRGYKRSDGPWSIRTRSVRAPRRRAWSDGVRPAVRPLARFLEASGSQLDRRPDAGEGARAGVGTRRQPACVGRPHGHAGRGQLPPRAEQPGPAPAAGPVRAVAPPADRVLPRARRRALPGSTAAGSTSSSAACSRSSTSPGGPASRPA